VVVVHDMRPDVGDARQIRHGRGLKDSLGVVTSYVKILFEPNSASKMHQKSGRVRR